MEQNLEKIFLEQFIGAGTRPRTHKSYPFWTQRWNLEKIFARGHGAKVYIPHHWSGPRAF